MPSAVILYYCRKNSLQKKYLPLSAAIGWLIISVILLTLPGTAFPTEDWLDKIWFDKWVHIGMFAIMVWLWCLVRLSLRPGSELSLLKRSFTAIAVVSLGYGIVMEFVQLYFVPLRSFDTGDIIADAVGCAAGWIYSHRRYIKK
ncbi:MAG: VanZ family protein [Chitinophagaceae bacterium]|nr:VanZ family protein [Chitinophagaceae bacterium]